MAKTRAIIVGQFFAAIGDACHLRGRTWGMGFVPRFLGGPVFGRAIVRGMGISTILTDPSELIFVRERSPYSSVTDVLTGKLLRSLVIQSSAGDV